MPTVLAGLLVSRAAVGLGEGVAPSAATDMVARIGKDNERSRSMSFIFSGLHVGSLLGLLLAPQLIDRFGWQTVRSQLHAVPHRYIYSIDVNGVWFSNSEAASQKSCI